MVTACKPHLLSYVLWECTATVYKMVPGSADNYLPVRSYSPPTLSPTLPPHPPSSFLHLQGLHSVSRAIIHVDDDAKKEGKGESYKLLVEGTDLLGVLGTVGEQPLVVPL